MAKGTTLKLFWHVNRSRGGTGDYWLNLHAERDGKPSGSCSISMSFADKMTPHELCMSALHLAENFMQKEADLGVLKHTMQYRIDTCPHKWLICDEAKEEFCLHCNEWQRDVEKNQKPSAIEAA